MGSRLLFGKVVGMESPWVGCCLRIDTSDEAIDWNQAARNICNALQRPRKDRMFVCHRVSFVQHVRNPSFSTCHGEDPLPHDFHPHLREYPSST